VNNNNTEQIGKFLFTSPPNERRLAGWLAGKGFKKKEERKRKKSFFLKLTSITIIIIK